MTPPDAVGKRRLELFESALEQPAHLRDSWLKANCVDPREQQALRKMLDRDDDGMADFEPPSPDDLSALIETSHSSGQRFGAFQLDSVISSGGMGIVWSASQESPARRVALKLIRQGFSTEQARRRFRYEAEILGRLNHSGIARIFEAGVQTEGEGASSTETPWFAMEFVEDAQSITKYATRQELGTKARLRLFMDACEALHHAHQRGVIHRDIKPQNLLVGANGEIKLIDFGASLWDEDGQGMTAPQTQAGQLLGTLLYMSPEQLEGRREDVAITSDVYSLGIVLFELLCGQLPFDTNQPSGSAWLQALVAGPKLLPRQVTPNLSVELEAVLLKCLETAPNARYGSAVALVEDLQRFLDREPVQARQATLWYRTRLYLKRHAGFVLATGIILVVALVGTAVSLKQAQRAEQSAQDARRSERSAHLRAAVFSLASGHEQDALRDLHDIPEEDRGFLWWSFDLQVDASTKVLRTPTAFGAPVALSPRADSYAVATDIDMLRSYDLFTGEVRWKQGGRQRTRTSSTWKPSLLPGKASGSAGIPWNRPTRDWRIAALEYDPTGQHLLVSSRWGLTFLDDDRAGVRIKQPLEGGARLLNSQVSADGAVKAWIEEEGSILHASWIGIDKVTPKSASFGQASAFALHRTGERIAFGRQDGQVVLCTRAERILIKQTVLIKPGLSAVTRMRFSPDGERLAIGRSNGSVEVWRNTGLLWRQAAHDSATESLAYDQSGQLLASGSRKGLIRIHAARDGHSQGVYHGHAGSVTAIQFLPTEAGFVSYGKDHTVRHWQIGRTGLRSLQLEQPQLGAMQVGESGKLYALTHAPRTRAIQSTTRTLQIIDPTVSLNTRSLTLGLVRYDQLGVSEKHGQVYAISQSGSLLRVDLGSGDVMEPLPASELRKGTRIDGLQVSPDGERLFLTMARGQLLMQEIGSKFAPQPWSDFAVRANLLTISKDGGVLAVSDESGTITLLDTRSAKRIHEVRIQDVLASAIALNQDGTMLAVAYPGRTGTIHLWSTEAQRLEETLVGAQGAITGISFHPSEPLLAANSDDEALHLWDIRDEQPIYSWNASNRALGPAFALDGSWLAGAGTRAELQIMMSRPAVERRHAAGYYRGFGRAADLPANQAAIQAWVLSTNSSAPLEAYEEARVLATHAVALDPSDPYVHLAMALVQLRLGRAADGLLSLASLDQLIAQGEWPARDQTTELLHCLLLAADGQRAAGLKIFDPLIKQRPYPSGLCDTSEGRRPLAEEARSLFKTDQFRSRAKTPAVDWNAAKHAR